MDILFVAAAAGEPSTATRAAPGARKAGAGAGGGKEVEELRGQITTMKLNIDNVEKERDFYFSKLRDCEILCQMHEFKHLPVVEVYSHTHTHTHALPPTPLFSCPAPTPVAEFRRVHAPRLLHGRSSDGSKPPQLSAIEGGVA